MSCLSWRTHFLVWYHSRNQKHDQQLRHMSERTQPEPIIPYKIPETSLIKIKIEIFDLHPKSYLIVVDYTKFFGIHSHPDKQSTTVIHHRQNIFGILQIVVSDGGPEFKSNAFERFAQNWDFQHNQSSALYPRSNSPVERTMQTVKRTLKKAMRSSQNPYLVLLALQTTPLIDAPVPATQLIVHRLYTILPLIDHQYKKKQQKTKNKNGSILHLCSRITRTQTWRLSTRPFRQKNGKWKEGCLRNSNAHVHNK